MEIFLAIVATLLVGPVAFYVLGHVSRSKHKFPSSLTGAIGDTIFLPLFNALAIYYGLFKSIASDTSIVWLSASLTLVFSFLYLVHRIKVRTGGEWMYEENGNFTFAAWYHVGFVVVQSFFIISSLLYFYHSVWLWLVLLGYVVIAQHTWISFKRSV